MSAAQAIAAAESFIFGNVGSGSLSSSLWGQASRTFASSLSGDITVIGTSSQANPFKVFATIELPALLENSRVTSIGGVAISDLRASNVFGAVLRQFTEIAKTGLFTSADGTIVTLSQQALERLGFSGALASTGEELVARGFSKVVTSAALTAAADLLAIAGESALKFLGGAVGGAIIDLLTNSTPANADEDKIIQQQRDYSDLPVGPPPVGSVTQNSDGSSTINLPFFASGAIGDDLILTVGTNYVQATATGLDGIASSGIAPNGAYWAFEGTVVRAIQADGTFVITGDNVTFAVHPDQSSTLAINGTVKQFTVAQSAYLSVFANSATVHTEVAAPNSTIDVKTFATNGTPIVLTNASGAADNSRLDVGGGNWSTGAPAQQNPALVDPRPNAPGGLGFASGAFHAATPNINANGYLPVAQNYLVTGNVNWARQTVQAAFDDFM